MNRYDEILTLDGEEFVVVDELVYENKKYLYVNSLKNEQDVAILEEYEKDGKKVVKSVEDSKFNTLVNLFAKKIMETE